MALWAVLAGALAGALGSAAWWWRRVRLPGPPRALVVHVSGVGADGAPWLPRAVKGLTERRLRQHPIGVRLVPDAESANIEARLEFRRTTGGIDLSSSLGPRGGLLTALATVHASSFAQALDQLVPELERRVSVRLDVASRDPAWSAEMARLGTRSSTAYLLYRSSVEAYFGSLMSDTGAVIAQLEQALVADPTWLHGYALLAVVQMARAGGAAEVLARARRAAGGASQDAVGQKLLEAIALELAGRHAEAAGLLDAEFRARPDDVVVGWVLMLALDHLHRHDEWIGIVQRLHAQRPDLQFGADLASALRDVGRENDVGKLLADWFQRVPENEQALGSLIAFELSTGHDAERLAREALLLHGEAPHRLATLCDVMLGGERTGEAQAIAYRLLREEGIDRTRGQRRLADVAMLEGRLGAARDSLELVVREGRRFGLEGGSREALEALRSLAPRVGDSRSSEQLSVLLQEQGLDAARATAQLEEALVRARPGQCPDARAAASRLPDGSVRDDAFRDMLRVSAEHGCARCEDVVKAGLSSKELSVPSLFRFALCAEQVGALELAADTLQRIRQVRTTTTHPPPFLSSTYHAILARYHLGRVLERLGRPADARIQYQSFLARWGHADRPVREVDDARGRLSRLESAGR